MRMLVVNAGSSTLKLRVLGPGDAVEGDATVDPWDGTGAADAVLALLGAVGPVDVVAHRIVHGGQAFTSAVLLTPAVESSLAALTPLAPVHQPRSLAALAAARNVLPDTPHVACFDTAFHAGMPVAARTYALPAEWRERWGLQRFGFHGLSHAWASSRGRELAGLHDEARVVSCHLGSGASLCAIVGGRSVDTTMGFTPLDGIVMSTRSGAVDPGLVLWLIGEGHLRPSEVADGLERRSGLEGLSGVGGDMRDVLASRAAGAGHAILAFDVYVHRLRQGIAAMAASLGGIDLLVFTGGVGEHAAPVRAAAVEGCSFLGLRLDPTANEQALGDADVTGQGAVARTAVVTCREDLEMARQVRAVVAGGVRRLGPTWRND